jgi:hypothetical protein
LEVKNEKLSTKVISFDLNIAIPDLERNSSNIDVQAVYMYSSDRIEILYSNMHNSFITQLD